MIDGYAEAFLALVKARTEKLLADELPDVDVGADFWVGVDLGAAVAYRLAKAVFAAEAMTR